MSKLAFAAAVKTAVLPLLTRKLLCGAAISCAVGIGLGVWLQPPKLHDGSSTPIVIAPQEQPNLWGDAAQASPAPDSQPYAQASTDQVAAVSPPADAQPVQLAQADAAQVAGSGDTRPSDADSDPDGPPPDRAQPRRRGGPGYDPRDRDNEDDLDDAPPPAQWYGPPPRRSGPPDDGPGPGPGGDGPLLGGPDGGAGGRSLEIGQDPGLATAPH